MTIMATSGRELNIATIARLAHIMAGLLEESQQLSSSQRAIAMDFLGVLMSDLQADGITARASSIVNVQLAADDREYTMPATVLDVIGTAAYIPAGETVTASPSELPIELISLERWLTLGAKDSTGQPRLAFVDRQTTPPVVHLWPIPDEAGTARFQVHRHLADCTDSSATLDLEKYWEGAIITQLAACLAEAKGMPDSKVNRLYSKAYRLMSKAKSMANDHVDIQGYVSR